MIQSTKKCRLNNESRFLQRDIFIWWTIFPWGIMDAITARGHVEWAWATPQKCFLVAEASDIVQVPETFLSNCWVSGWIRKHCENANCLEEQPWQWKGKEHSCLQEAPPPCFKTVSLFVLLLRKYSILYKFHYINSWENSTGYQKHISIWYAWILLCLIFFKKNGLFWQRSAENI